MGPTPTPSPEPIDVERYRLPEHAVGPLSMPKRLPRHAAGESFIKGPIPHAWIAKACRLPGSGLHLASSYWYLCRRYRRPNRTGLDALASELGMADNTARKALHAAEEACLLSVEREPGCKLAVSILDVLETAPGPPRKPLYGPIPWAWWLAAVRLDGPALPVAVACWMEAGWGRSAEFELALAGWSELGLSRFAAGRGLASLEGAGLVEVSRRPGRSPLVTLLGRRGGESAGP